MMGGKAFGIVLIALVILGVALSVAHTKQLELERTQTIAQLVSMPEYAQCKFDVATCPQAVDQIVVPETSTAVILILGILLGAYLIRSDLTQRSILKELSGKREQLSAEERKTLMYSVLLEDERKIIDAVREQPGISQATLRLRTDMSKAKLSMLLKDLEKRSIIKKIEDGKTNAVHLKRGEL